MSRLFHDHDFGDGSFLAAGEFAEIYSRLERDVVPGAMAAACIEVCVADRLELAAVDVVDGQHGDAWFSGLPGECGFVFHRIGNHSELPGGFLFDYSRGLFKAQDF